MLLRASLVIFSTYRFVLPDDGTTVGLNLETQGQKSKNQYIINFSKTHRTDQNRNYTSIWKEFFCIFLKSSHILEQLNQS